MECSCGGSTGAPKEASNSKLDALLIYHACNACGRVSGDQIYIKGELVRSGPGARQCYQTLDAQNVQKLLEDSKNLAPSTEKIDWGQTEVGETACLF